MFICENCALGNVDSIWFVIGMLSYGPCEICKKTASCVDAPGITKKKENTLPTYEVSETCKAHTDGKRLAIDPGNKMPDIYLFPDEKMPVGYRWF